MMRLCVERTDALLREDRAHRFQTMEDLQDRQLQHIEEARALVEAASEAAKAELAKLDRMARKAEADARRRELDLQDGATKLIERLSTDLIAGVRDGTVIRAKAYSTDKFVKAVGVAVIVLLITFAAGCVVGSYIS